MNDLQTMQTSILTALKAFSRQALPDAAAGFFESLGYTSSRKLSIHSLAQLQELLDPNGSLTEENALLSRWRSIHLLFQLTEAEIKANTGGQLDLGMVAPWEAKDVRSYVFFAIDLAPRADGTMPTRTELSQITRALNRLVPMPVLVLFRHKDTVSLAIINRRKNMKDGTRDVLTRVSLIRDIACSQTHRAHIDLLRRFSLQSLREESGTIRTFADLDNAWQKLLSIQELNERFYRELVDWFTWTKTEIKLARLPDYTEDNQHNRDVATQQFTVRLICRTLFAWFLKEMRLIPTELLELYDAADHRRVLTAGTYDPMGNQYYRGILQNVFFQALNRPMDQRRKSGPEAANDRTVTKAELKKLAYIGKNQLPESFDYDLFDCIPYLNGGLFDSLPEDNASDTIEDGAICIPNKLFYATATDGFTIEVGGKKKTRRAVEGLNRIFDRYRFTVAENTPLEEDVALDPELLGLVFENLLAEIDPDDEAAAESARKASGSYYTPRRIVDYMVNEALHLHLRTEFEEKSASREDLQLLSRLCYELPDGADFSSIADRVVDALESVRVLDPACGSGAFPMGMLHRMVELLSRVDRENERWIQRLLSRLPAPMRADARKGMEGKSYNYLRKLGLIQKNLYGLDIQPLATLIAKLRFFLTLVIEQEIHTADRAHNYGLQSLPNLETNLLCANSLNDANHGLLSGPVLRELREAREEYYQPNTSRERRNALALAIGEKLATLFPGFAQQTKGIVPTGPTKIDRENMRRQQDAAWLAEWFKHATVAAPFFNVETFFPELIAEGQSSHPAPFHIVIGNPPYGVDIDDSVRISLGLGSKDSYGAFIARFLGDPTRPSPLAEGGVLAYIVSDTFMTIKTHRSLREQMLAHRIHKMIRVHQKTFNAVVNCAVILCQRGVASDEHTCQMADLTNVSIFDQHERFLHLLYQTEGFSCRQNVANKTYAIYHYRQSLIRTNSNIPFFVASPKLFALMNDTTASVRHEPIGGRRVPVRTVQLNGQDVRLIKLCDFAEVVGGVKTYDNSSYVRNVDGTGRYDPVPASQIIARELTEMEKLNGIRVSGHLEPKYVPFDKSGEMISGDGRLINYFKPVEFFIDWSEDAVSYYAENNGLRNQHRYFQKGITYSVTGVYAPTFRIGCGSVFGQKGATIFADGIDQMGLLGILCSLQTRFLVKNFLSHGVDATDSIIEQIVLPITLGAEVRTKVETILTEIQKNSGYDYASCEQGDIDRLVYTAFGLNEADIREVEDWYARRYPKLASAQRRALAAKQGKTEEQLLARSVIHLYCDESRHLPHDRESAMLMGSLACPAERIQGYHQELKTLRAEHRLSPHFEVKWTKVSPGQQAFYLAVVDWFLSKQDLQFRALILPDKAKTMQRLPEVAQDHLYYRLYYQLLRSQIDPENRYRAFLDIKDTRGRKKLSELKKLLQTDAAETACLSQMQHVRSHEIGLMQITDLLLGAVGYARRENAGDGSPAKQSLVRHLEEKMGYQLTADSPPGSQQVMISTWHDQDALLL